MIIFIAIIFVICVVFSFILSRLIWNLVDTPTVTPSGALIGRCEVDGKARHAEATKDFRRTVVSPISRTECVWFDLSIEEYVKAGKSSHWRMFQKYSYKPDFVLADPYGSIAVEVPKSGYDLEKIYYQNTDRDINLKAYDYFYPGLLKSEEGWTLSPDNTQLWHDKIDRWIPTEYVSVDGEKYFDDVMKMWVDVSPDSIMDSIGSVFGAGKKGWKNKTRVTEYIVRENQQLFAHGVVRPRENGSELVIGQPSSTESIKISYKGEDSLLTGYKKYRIACWVVAIITDVIFVSIFKNSELNMQGWDFPVFSALVINALLFVFIGLLMVLFRTYNRFVRLKEQVAMSRSSIGICEKRRAELIPQLCKVIEGATNHEEDVQTRIAKLRTSVDASKDIAFLLEDYPVLKTAENFMFLQLELARTEEIISMSRSFYNDSVLAIDNLRATIPGMVMSPFFSKSHYTTDIPGQSAPAA